MVLSDNDRKDAGIMIKCEKILKEDAYGFDLVIINNGVESEPHRMNLHQDIWIVTEDEKYRGIFVLHFPVKENTNTIICISCSLDLSMFAVCFESIKKEYPENIFEVQVPLACEKDFFPYIVEQAHFVLKSRNERYSCYYYVNGLAE